MRIEPDEHSDDRLLQDFVLLQSHEAFAALVRRHGPMVWNICSRIAGHSHDAEDAFQATFAILVRKARFIRRKRSIGAWLHQVARRSALRAKAVSRRLGTAEDAVVIDAQAPPASEGLGAERGELLDQEISRLPERLRLPVILCYLQGLTNREAAERLNCPEGTIVSRLARARNRLRERLIQRGLVLGSAAAVSALLAEAGSAAPLLPELAQAALNCAAIAGATAATAGPILSAAAARLAGETGRLLARRSLLIRLGVGLGSACAMGILLSMGIFTPGLRQDRVAEVSDHEQPVAAQQAATAPLDGVWQGEDLEYAGGANPEEHARLSKQSRWIVDGGKVRFKWQDMRLATARYQTDGTPGPTRQGIDFTLLEGFEVFGNGTLRGAVAMQDGVLEVCTAEAGGHRPESISPGLVPPGADPTTVRAGLAGYSRLTRLARSFEEEDLQGRWELTNMEAGGMDRPFESQQRHDMNFADNGYVLHHVEGGRAREIRGTFRLDPAQPARFMELTMEDGGPALCLYEIEGDRLRMCLAAPGAARPRSLQPDPALSEMLLTFERGSQPASNVLPYARPWEIA